MHYNAVLGPKNPIMSTKQAPLTPKEDGRKPQNADEIFLSAVAKCVRAARSRRGMTRKQLAHDADVSERLLAQLEMGEGNISIVLLRRVTDALNITLTDLFMDVREPQPEKRFIQNLLERLPEDRLQ